MKKIYVARFSVPKWYMRTKAINSTYGLNPGSKISDGWDHSVGDIVWQQQ
jgi:hypothetical protein